MKVLLITASYKPAYIYGGPIMSVAKLSEELVKAGCSVEVLTTTANGRAELPVVAGSPVEIDRVTVTYFKRLTKDHSHFSPALLRKLWTVVRNFEIVHIQAWWNFVSVLACLIALLRGVPVLVSPRGTLSPYSFNNRHIGIKWLMHRLFGRVLLHKSHLHVTSAREQEATLRIAQPKSINNLPNFVKLAPVALSFNYQPQTVFKLLFFSRIEEKKGLDILLMALPQVSANFSLTIAGDGEPGYIARLKARAASLGLQDRVTWAGFFNEDKFDLLRKHDLFVLPSHDENFGNAVIESLSVGTPVLISKEVGLEDYVRERKLGWLCETNSGALSHAINDIILNQENELHRIRTIAPGVIAGDFDEAQLSQKYIEMYKKILNYERLH